MLLSCGMVILEQEQVSCKLCADIYFNSWLTQKCQHIVASVNRVSLLVTPVVDKGWIPCLKIKNGGSEGATGQGGASCVPNGIDCYFFLAGIANIDESTGMRLIDWFLCAREISVGVLLLRPWQNPGG